MKTASRDEDSKSQQTARPVAILIVADNAVLARTLAITIKGFGGRGTAVGTVREALKHLAERATWAGVILDLCLSDGLGTRVLEWLRAKNETGRDLPVVLLTGHPDHSAVSIAHNLRAQFLEKPATTAQIEQFFRFAEQQARIRCQNELTPAPDFPADADPLGYFAAAILRERRAASADALRSFWRIGALVNGLRKQAKPHCLRAVRRRPVDC
jgi:ActR/RegA family two-component response regulator